MKVFKKKGSALAVAASMLMASATVAPRRADAVFGVVIGALGGNPVAATLFVLGAVGAGAGSVHFFRQGYRASGAKALANYFFAAACAVGAYFLLDGDEADSGEFKSMDAKGAERLGLSLAEWQAYELDLPLLNSLREEVIVRANSKFKDLKIVGDREVQSIAEHVRTQWNTLSEGMLAPETISAIQKLGRAAVSQN